ncbi:sugar kinase [Halalkalibacter alkaliphilus]|uniref:Sugar kinase n=1 Tax=Halalkalibacter alkaliphilus TaxID=2917993 RepID=A0A9X1ZWP6_9BACI|nr:sugar kinase [Halalkalibacter alkaliphilus]MCL7745761.1 sugar kinase [Halalkalibacter alkaliphilus]
MYDVITVGETMTLLTSENGTMLRSPSLSKGFGGAESNVAIGLTRLGHKVSWISKLGMDPFGDEILYHLRGEGVDTSYVKRSQTNPTGLMIKELKSIGDPAIYYYRKDSAASTLSIEDLDLNVIKKAKVVHLTGITPALSGNCQDVIFKIVEYAYDNNVKISFDPNLRLKLWKIEEAREFILKLLPYVDYFFPGIEEAELLTNSDPERSTPQDLCSYFISKGVKNVILKLGKEGCAVSNEVDFTFISGFTVEAIDTVGAGDGFCAGFLSGLLNNLSLKESASRANAVGAMAVTAKGDYDALPTRKELDVFLGGKQEIKR